MVGGNGPGIMDMRYKVKQLIKQQTWEVTKPHTGMRTSQYISQVQYRTYMCGQQTWEVSKPQYTV